MDDKKIVIITGRITSGKTTFLRSILFELESSWSIGGFLSIASTREYHSNIAARDYHIQIIGQSQLYPWAIRNETNTAFDFDETTRDLVTQKVIQRIDDQDIILMDDIGFLEIMGQGFDQLVALSIAKSSLVISVKKEILTKFLERYGIDSYLLIDLDELRPKIAKKKLFHFLKSYDGEKIALYASINGVAEVGIGSLLHSIRLPFKGYFLAGLQNFLLILFGKELKGRNLFWIVMISAGLKSFSPVGSRLMPMIYIFIQGLFFLLPSFIWGWRLIPILLGSVLMGQVTLFLSLGTNYLLYGMAFFDGYLKAANYLLSQIGLNDLSLTSVIIFFVFTKLVVSIAVFSVACFFNFKKLVSKLERKVQKIIPADISIPVKHSWKRAFKASLQDIFSLRFIFSILFIGIVIFFFAGLTDKSFMVVMIRAIVLSWFGFLISRRINFGHLINFLNRHDLSYVAFGLKKALSVVESFRKARR